MEKFRLNNGLQVINAGYSKDYTVCVGFSVGYLNEPKPGLAHLFERLILMQKRGVLPYYGGTSTAFGLSGDDIEEVLETLAKFISAIEITEETVALAKAEISEQTIGKEIPVRQEMRSMFYRLVLGLEQPVDAYLEHINSYSVDDVKSFKAKYYTAANAILLIASPDNTFYGLRSKVETLFGGLESGEKQGGFSKKTYCGGYGHVNSFDGINFVTFGWDLSKFCIKGNSVLEVLLQAFVKELGQNYIKARLFNVSIDMKIVSFFGVSLLRVIVYSKDASLSDLSRVVYVTIKKMCVHGYEKELPKMQTDKPVGDTSNVSDLPEERLFEIFEQVTGQIDFVTYDESADSKSSLEETTSEDIKLLAHRLFVGEKFTCVTVSVPNGDEGLQEKILSSFTRLKNRML